MRLLALAASVLSLCSAVVAQTYTIRTFAGGVLPENIAGVSASLGGVSGVAVDSAGNVFAALSDYNIVVRLDGATGMLTRVAGNGTRGFSGDNGPATQAELAGPAGIAIDAVGNLYIADEGNARIRKVSAGGIVTVAGSGAAGYSGDNGVATDAQLNGPSDVAVDSAGNLYIADYYNQAVRQVSNGAISTVAGTGSYGYSGDHGPATQAQLAGPMGVTVDAAGNLYIAEAFNNTVRKVANGVITTVAGLGVAGYTGDNNPAIRAALRQPTGVSISASGNLYIADSGNNRIRMASPGGMITTVTGNGTAACAGDNGSAALASLGAPWRVASDAAGNVYLTDSGRIRKVSRGLVGSVIRTIAGGADPAGENGPAASAQLLTPQGLAFDSGGNLYISDFGTGRVLKVAGQTISRAAGANAQFGAPSGVAVDAAGNLYVADSQNARVQKASGTTVRTIAGGGTAFGDSGPATKAQLSAPQGIAVDASGKLYIVDQDRVRMVSGGTISTVAGNGTDGYQGDNGPATAAMLSSPSGIAVDASGNFVIADSVNNRVRMVSVADGTISTVAGNGTYDFTGNNGNATSAAVGMPSGVAVSPAGDIYITDARRILKVSKGKINTIGGLTGAQGIAVDTAGNVYVADPASHQVRVLTPAGTECAATVSPASPQFATGGGPVTVTVQTAASCTWVVENLPAWLSAAGDSFGVGPGSVTLLAAANRDAPRAATVLIGGRNVAASQAGMETIVGQVTIGGAPLPGVTIALSGGQTATSVSDSGGYYSFSGLVSTASYTVTPSFAGYSFAPASQTFSNVNANPTANFAGFLPPQITGLAPAFASTLQPIPQNMAAGEMVTISGVNLCGDPASATPTLPDRLASCIAVVDGTNIHLYSAGPTQIMAVLPQALTLGTHQLAVQRYADTSYKQLAAASAPLSFTVDRVAMAFLERMDGSAAMLSAQYSDAGYASGARPLTAGDLIGLYLTGLGRKAQTFPEGAAPKVNSAALEPIQITVQGQTAQVVYAGAQSQYPGLDEILVQLPKYTLPAGKSTATFQISAPSAGQTLQYEIPSH